MADSLDFIARPADVRAVRYTGHNATEVLQTLCGLSHTVLTGQEPVDLYIHDHVRETTLVVHPGEWVIRPGITVERRFFKVPDDLFRMLYLPAGQIRYKAVPIEEDGRDPRLS